MQKTLNSPRILTKYLLNFGMMTKASFDRADPALKILIFNKKERGRKW